MINLMRMETNFPISELAYHALQTNPILTGALSKR